ncbi:MAG: hypothetical protein KDI13_03475 [Alphaproteobacteria bacterium]|nr:hypothetical protein [Alphaproteobacteria bacterium]
MRNYQPSLGIGETSQNIRFFISANMDVMWRVYKPLLPYILGCYAFDAVMSALFFSEGPNGFMLGAIVSSYFMAALAIDWHRVVIEGPDNFSAMNPFKPKKHELAFLGVGLLIGIVYVLGVGLAVFLFFAIGGQGGGAFGSILAVAVGLYIIYKFSFYFPAKAVDSSITLKESFGLTRGYMFRIIAAPMVASWKLLLGVMAYGFVMGMAMYFVRTGLGPQAGWIGMFVFSLPLYIYFKPLFMVIGVTSLSNYYMHAMQNKNESVTRL